jgi:DNA helicase-2/ATP-dependent DNA helicase PcrA
VDTATAYDLAGRIVRESGIMNEMMASNDPEDMSRRENLEELLNGISDFVVSRQEEGEERVKMPDFLGEVSLLSDQDNDKEEDQEKVTLMTIHSAKGLEFKNVFVVGMEEQLFPSAMAGDSPRALEEERRLCYVAITRAEEHCFLSFAKTRFKYGKMEFGSPSRFLREIDPNLMQMQGGASQSRPSQPRFAQPSQPRFTASSSYDAPSSSRLKPLKSSSTTAAPTPSAGDSSLCEGQQILHERFGRGVILKVEGTGENTKATVQFENAGVKQLLMKFARFKII